MVTVGVGLLLVVLVGPGVEVGPGVDVTGTLDVERTGVAVVGKILVEGRLWERDGVAVVIKMLVEDVYGVAVLMGTIVEDGGGVCVRVVVIAIMVVMGIAVLVEAIVVAGSVVGNDVVEGGVEDGAAAIAHEIFVSLLKSCQHSALYQMNSVGVTQLVARLASQWTIAMLIAKIASKSLGSHYSHAFRERI